MDIQEIYRKSKNEDAMSIHSIEKNAFESMLLGMIIKVSKNKTSKGVAQLSSLKRMERFLNRLTYFNVMFVFQSKLILEQEHQLAVISQKMLKLELENESLKENIS